jgi:hypothetical protein
LFFFKDLGFKLLGFILFHSVFGAVEGGLENVIYSVATSISKAVNSTPPKGYTDPITLDRRNRYSSRKKPQLTCSIAMQRAIAPVPIGRLTKKKKRR